MARFNAYFFKAAACLRQVEKNLHHIIVQHNILDETPASLIFFQNEENSTKL
jgi:hypothetical protein